MATNQSKLEQLCDIITDNVVNDIEHAKYIIAEADCEDRMSDTEATEKIKIIRELAFREMNKEIINNITSMGIVLHNSVITGCTVFSENNIDRDAVLRIYYNNIEGNADNYYVSNIVDEEKLQFN